MTASRVGGAVGGMHHSTPVRCLLSLCVLSFCLVSASAQIGSRFPSEKKVIEDPVTGTTLSFLTSKPVGDSKIYQTHPQWTSDGEWLVFRSDRVAGEAMAVNEATGDLVQVTEGGYFGMLTLARAGMKLYVMRDPASPADKQPQYGRNEADKAIVEVDLAALFRDSAAGKLSGRGTYERVVGMVPASMGAGGDMAIDANNRVIYFRVGAAEAAKHLAPGAKVEGAFGPRNMGAGPTGIAKMDIATGDIGFVVAAPFQMGHIQTNPWVEGELVYCWETGGKSPQRVWTVRDGGEPRMLFPESEYDWVTHEAIITKDEVAIAIMGHREPGTDDAWGPSGTRIKPTGLGIVNLRTGEVRMAGQTRSGSGLWHVHGSADGRWAVGDDFERSLYLIDRTTDEMMLLTAGHKETARDHVHPTFSPDGTKIQIQSAMLSEDGRAMNICIVYLPEELLERDYEGVKRVD